MTFMDFHVHNPYYFFSIRKPAAFCESCNLIGSGSRQNFFCLAHHPERNPSPGCVSLSNEPVLGPKIDFFEAF